VSKEKIMKSKLIALVKEQALEIAAEGQEFTLKSGAKSKYYLDCRNLHLNPRGLHCVVTYMSTELRGLEFDAIGGPSIGADPIVGGFMFLMGLTVSAGRFKGFLIRKESKDHGKGGRIVGPLKQGDRCVVVEDVTTSGGSAMDAVNEVVAFGAKVVQVVSVVDRLQGAEKLFAEANIPYKSLLTIRDLGLE